MRVGRGRNLGTAEWRQLLEEWRASGLTQAAFCKRRGIHQATFSGRKQQLALWLAKEPAMQPAPRQHPTLRHHRRGQAAFVEARISDATPVPVSESRTSRVRPDAGIELVIDARLSIRLSCGFDVGSLQSVLRALDHSP